MINAKHTLMLMNVLHVIIIIIAYKILMEISMDNAYVVMVILMIIQIINANNVLNFGYFIYNIYYYIIYLVWYAYIMIMWFALNAKVDTIYI